MLSLRMLRGFLTVCSFLLILGCSANTIPPTAELTPEADFQATADAFWKLEDPDDKAKLWNDFLARNPGNDYTVGVIEYLSLQHLIQDKNNPEAAFQLVEEWVEKLQDTPYVRQLRDVQLQVLGEAKQIDRLRSIRSEMLAGEGVSIEERRSLYEAAIKAEDWETAREDSQYVVDRVTEEQIRKEMGQAVAEADIRDGLRRRRAPALMNLGWSLTNLNHAEQALPVFEEAAELGQFTFAGFSGWPTEELDNYYSRALLKSGDAEGAMERILPLALIGDSLEALDLLKTAFKDQHGSLDGFELWVETARERVAKVVPSFVAYDYEGEEVNFDSLRGRVTLLAFWFPT